MQSTGQGSKKILKCALLFALLFTTGATAQAKLSVSPSPMNFGSQTVGVASPSMAVALTNNTSSSIKIVGVSVAPVQFSYSGASLPITLGPGQSLMATVAFTPTAAQAYPGTLTFIRANGMTVIDNLHGRGIQTAVQSPNVTTQPSSQTITAGQTATFSVTASGTAPLSYQWRQNGTAISGATSSSYTTPAETTSASGAQFTVVVSNTAGNATSNAAILTVNPAPAAPTITTQPANETITAGQTATFSVTASGTAPLSYQWRQNGTAISGATSSSYTTQAETTSASGAQFTVVVSNTAGSITSSAATLTVNALPSGALTPSTTSLNFNNVIVGNNSTLSVNFTNSGSSNITVSNVTISGAGFTTSGVSTGQIITSGQLVTLVAEFAPAATGSVTGNVTVTSNASNSPVSISLSGAGVLSHTATLNWTTSTSTVIGYDVYRGTVSGGPYTEINSSVDANATFTDTTVQPGQTYYWVVTAVNSSSVQSAYSSQVSATIPTP